MTNQNSLGLHERFTVAYIEREVAAIFRCVCMPANNAERAKSLAIDARGATDNDVELTLNYINNYRKGLFMDKQIKKVKRDIDKGDKAKGEKDVGKLLKMDKKFDKKLDKCSEKMHKGKK